MVITLHTVLLLLSLIFLALATAGVPATRINFLALGLAFFVLDQLLTAARLQ